MLTVPATPPEIAKLLSVKPETVRAWIERRELEAVNLAAPGTTRPRWRIMPDALERFLQSRSNRRVNRKTPRRRSRSKKLKLAFMK